MMKTVLRIKPVSQNLLEPRICPVVLLGMWAELALFFQLGYACATPKARYGCTAWCANMHQAPAAAFKPEQRRQAALF